MVETDWELKDRRIAWMNCNTSASVIIAARINAGLFKPKDNKEAMKELLDAITIEFGAFLDMSLEKKIKKASWFCTLCNKEITEKVKAFSEDKFGRALCYECQNNPVKE